MAGLLDKIKGMFAGAKEKATDKGAGHDTHDDDKVRDVNPGVGSPGGPADASGTNVGGTVPGDSDHDSR